MDGGPVSSPLTDADRAVRDWLRSLLGEDTVRFGTPSAPPSGEEADDEPTMSVHALDLVHESSGSIDVHRPAPATVWVRYLLCATRPGSVRAFEHLDVVLSAVLDPRSSEGREVPVHLDSDVAALPLWSALGVPPRPGVVLRARTSISRAAKQAPPVTAPLRVEGGPVRSLSGRLVGPGEVPLAGAEVTVPSTGARSRTGTDGDFTLASVPTGPLALAIRVKGRSFDVAVEPSDEPVLVHCDLTEELR